MEYYVGYKIRALRKKKQMSQQELCGDFMNRSILSRIENNRMEPSLHQIIYIANKLDTPIHYFFYDVDYTENIPSDVQSVTHELQNLFVKESFHKIIDFFNDNHDEFKKLNDFNKYYYLGMSCYHDRINKESLRHLRKYVNLYIRNSDAIQSQYIINFGNALNTLCKIMIVNNNYEKGRHYLYMAIKYLIKYNSSNSFIYFVVINNLSYIYNQILQYEKTILLIENFLRLNTSLSYRSIVPQLHLLINKAYSSIGNYEMALHHIKKSILLLSYEEDQYELGRCYINYINDLRYSLLFEDAFKVVSDCLNQYANDSTLYVRFLVQKVILLFYSEEYIAALESIHKLNLKFLTKMDRNNCYFMMGHIHYLNRDFEVAHQFLLKSEKFFIQRGYSKDLVVLYDDLYAITNYNSYKEKSNLYQNAVGRKNIFA
ncbi:helix-turn-helix domain-containing protein [Alkaliphilus oremlandii]|uniref:Transcriptional regulator, XRE family n=1 Tax=Alkaliphilus oremlandii (strain OhILAs) TaxID=350688 RepID=A8MKY0_ALKOO|nr:helix-turn-helix transcriptional regulator [Alkaliphilus oremlandii]ABW17797.1 transcriptional regulator, XRE family [Alkaliphilus oremlandii OhILAs]